MFRISLSMANRPIHSRDERLSMPPDAVQSMQENLDRGKPVIYAAYGLIGAIVLFGGLGLLADRYFGTSPWCVLVGLVAGLGIGFYQLRGVRN